MKYGLLICSLTLAGAVFAAAAPLPKVAVADEAVQVAQSGPMDMIKKRESLMKQISKTRKALGKAAKKGKIGAKEVAEAQKIVALATEWSKKSTWPEGSDSGHYKSRAKPEIWKDWASFAGRQAKLYKASVAALDAAKAGDAKAVRKQLSAMGCGGCHKRFRGPKPK